MVENPIHKLNLDKLIFNISTLKLRMLTLIGSFEISKSLFTTVNSLKRENWVRTNFLNCNRKLFLFYSPNTFFYDLHFEAQSDIDR